MNSFVELHTDADYRNTNREYYTGTWEYINVGDSPNNMPPWQLNSSADHELTIERESVSGAFTDITGAFYSSSQSEPTSWSKTGGGTWSASGGEIQSGTADSGGYHQSNTFSLTADRYRFYFDVDEYTGGSAGWQFKLLKGAVEIFSASTYTGFDGSYHVDIDTAGSDYSLKIVSTGGSVTSPNTPYWQKTGIMRDGGDGDYFWYSGRTFFVSAIEDISRLRVTCGSDVFYSDWMDPCGYDGKVKISLSSTVDYGGVKYDEGYEQWIYKEATVRRSPRADIEITAEQRNGKRIDEKRVSAIRYVCQVKVTESEYEAFVHAAAGNLEITDPEGRVYDCTGVEMNDPVWYNGNGLLEISFNDENNINIHTLNNSSL